MKRQADQLALVGLVDGLRQRVEEGGVGRRVVERAAVDIERGDAAFGDQEADRAVGRRSASAPIHWPSSAVFLGRGAHQGDVGVVVVEQAVL